MKLLFALILTLTTHYVLAQNNEGLAKGKNVYVQQTSANDEVKNYNEQIIKEMKDWGYWNVIDKKENADIIFDMKADSHKGITMTSWGGQTVAVSVALLNKAGEKLWQSETYEASPNGLNGFNGGKSAVRKLIKGLKKKFK
jgi:hypothetical protein